MSQYSGPAYTTVNLNGSFNNWCGGCAVMTDPDNDGIFELMVNVSTAAPIEWKYTLDGWNGQENLTPGSACTQTRSIHQPLAATKRQHRAPCRLLGELYRLSFVG